MLPIIVPCTSSEEVSATTSYNNKITTITVPCAQRITDIQKKTFAEHEFKIIQELVKNSIYIAQYDDMYHNALVDIKRQEIISVNSESCFGRLDTKRPLLTITTPNKVYLFDMLRLGAMKSEFKEVFSTNLPRKVVHSSAEIVDYLRHKENCNINNLFDTLV